jgi:hypothetical protein
MRLRVSENGLVIPPSFMAGLDEVEIIRDGDLIKIQKVDNIPNKDSIDISIFTGALVNKLLEKKLKKIQDFRKNQTLNATNVALSERYSELCREIQGLQTDHPLSEAEIAAEIDAVRSSAE